MLDQSIFKAYDIRGIVDEGLTEETIFAIGKAIGSEAVVQKQTEICVGYDGRLSSPSICDTLIKGIKSTGMNTINIGLVTTPILYFSTFFLETNSGVMITGSHNPPNYNGFKMVINKTTLSSDDIQKLKQRILEDDFIAGKGKSRTKDVKTAYKDKILGTIKLKRKMKVAIDCGNGAGGVIAKE